MSAYEAVKSLLEGVPGLAGRVKDTAFNEVGNIARGTYLVLYGAGPETLTDGRWGAVPRAESDAEFSFPLRAISDDPGAVRELGDRVQSIVGEKPVVAGRRCDPVTISFEYVQVDNSVSPPMFFMDMFVDFWSRRS